jgi:pimeloyl-ACP methyl ester carboxylesterase
MRPPRRPAGPAPFAPPVVFAPALGALLTGVLIALLSAAGCGREQPVAHTIALNGIRMYYEIVGQGPPLLLLHGGGGNGMQFDKQIPELRKHHRLIVPDMCAQGRTSDRPDSLTYHAMAEDVVALLDSLGIQRTDIMGWSDGGIVGLDVAMNHPDRVDHLVTFGANFTPDGLNPQDIAWMERATADSFGPGMEEGYKKLAPDPSHYRVAMTKILDMWRTQPNYTPEQLGRIRAKTMICAGERDVIRPEHTRALAAAIPGAVLWIVPDASHSAMQEKPDLVNAKVTEFLAR